MDAHRNDHATSLFEHVPANINAVKGDDPNYCQCDTGVTGPARINCTAKGNGPVHTLHVSSKAASHLDPGKVTPEMMLVCVCGAAGGGVWVGGGGCVCVCVSVCERESIIDVEYLLCLFDICRCTSSPALCEALRAF